MLHFFHPDQTVTVKNDWPDVTDDCFTPGTVLFDPNDKQVPWATCTGKYGAVKSLKYEEVPAWMKAAQLIFD